MIGFLSGIIKSKEINNLILDVHGVGYQVYVPVFVLEDCRPADKKSFFIHTHVKEDEISLFGFNTLEDKQIFLGLISVSGVGPKIALNIISFANGASKIIKAIQIADVDFFSSVKGIGKKTGQRIIVDLKSKFAGLKDLEFESESNKDLIEALKNLGFSKEEIKKSIKDIKKDLSLEEKIRQALKSK